MLKKLQIRDFRGIHDRPVIGGFYHSVNMIPVDGGKGLGAIAKITNSEIEGTLANFTTPVNFTYGRTETKAFVLCDNAYIFSSATGGSDWVALGNNSGFSNNMIADQNDSIWVVSDAALKYWTAAAPRVWTDPSYSFTNGDAGVYHPAALVQAYVLWGDGNIVARIDTSGGGAGSFTASALTLPPGYVIKSITQAGYDYRKALIAANRNNIGAVFEWDVVSDEPSAIYQFNQAVMSLLNHNNRIFAILSDGHLYDITSYPPTLLFETPDTGDTDVNTQIQDNTIIVVGGKIYFGSNNSAFNRKMPGLWCYDLKTNFGYFVSPLASEERYISSTSYGVKALSVPRLGSRRQILIGSQQDATGNKGSLDKFNIGSAPTLAAYYISPIISDEKSILKGVKFKINPWQRADTSKFDVDVLASYYVFDTLLWGYAQQDGNESVKNKVSIDKSSTDSGDNPLGAEGDEIMVLNGSNAGYIRRITSVDVSGDPYVYTLDSNMAVNNPTETRLFIQKFKKFKIDVTNITSGDNIFIDCPDHPEFRKLLIKIEIRTTSGQPVLSDLDIIYETISEPLL
jgi:hypothetical protein|tara:strand:- start:4457 stop:6163 length:1707 start_codon:yes stop_codon:yes gene_type:complete